MYKTERVSSNPLISYICSKQYANHRVLHAVIGYPSRWKNNRPEVGLEYRRGRAVRGRGELRQHHSIRKRPQEQSAEREALQDCQSQVHLAGAASPALHLQGPWHSAEPHRRLHGARLQGAEV